MASAAPSTSTIPSSSTFSFTAPFPPSPTSSLAKQRRVSLALPSSPRIFPAWSFRDDTGLGVHSGDPEDDTSTTYTPEKRGKMRRIATDELRTDGETSTSPQPHGCPSLPEKKPRKKWTMEETQMLVAGCNKWGVGNWKSILNDPDFRFDGRSPVDLKDRFRTYYPDAYRQHYPNAKTHLSTKVRSALPDGSSIFEKTRSKKRRPFTEEEDRALKAGYDKHGTVWATIVKDPIFQAQNRRSTDLRDRFRNAFPDLYQAAGYKPRNTTKKKRDQLAQPTRAATDDSLATTSAAGPVRRKRRNTDQGIFRGGTKSVPESANVSEDEESSDEEDAPFLKEAFTAPPAEEVPMTPDETSLEVDMQAHDSISDSVTIPDFNPGSSFSEMTDSSQSQAWSSGIDTPVHSSVWSTATNAASPTSSHLSITDYFNNSPFPGRADGANQMIGKSAWGPQDWLSANPRLEPTSSSSSYAGGFSPAPSSPFSFAHMNHGVLDRYDLFPTSLAHDFVSEGGVDDAHSTFSDPEMFAASSYRGFTHHSNYAGDLIFGNRTHQPQHSTDYGPGFGFGEAGLGLSGLQPLSTTAMHNALRTPVLPGIDEIELTSITLDDPDVSVPMEETVDTAIPKDDPGSGQPTLNLSDLSSFSLPPQTLEEIIGLTQEIHVTPPGTPQSHGRTHRMQTGAHVASAHNRSISVPPSEHRAYDPRAPQTQHIRPKPLVSPTRSVSLMDYMPMHADQQTHAAQPMFSSLTQTANEMWKLPNGGNFPGQSVPGASSSHSGENANYDLPFLDLHYYSTLHGGNGAASGSQGSETMDASAAEQVRQGQALDLAQSFALQTKTLSELPQSLAQHIPMFQSWQNALSGAASAMGAQGMSRMPPSHHRGQSVVSPQDLLLTKGSDNKRKRSSWDGGPR
ncbi:uncharacterized protein TRAVEDRAFT_170743 [Trametes versicolor FP-101664 SS1]|uniref:uncharacterized protein n=1 Tax=Trametes versicolor (strain FP-101664) TaxID=717944 RepID=UPI0004623DF2|nr:uncharacterized protein TRAVEDRAFT_170743 [Trametes versicolor FP-101664 SS1]EIW56759.1 hypothetical protein TRAVEDRAFT_170743 [Trametes versicolor FP-101664 SS1]